MREKTVLLLLFFILLIPVASFSGHWDYFEHRYEYEPKDVLDADKFTKKDKYWEGYKGGKLAGYVLLSKEFTKKLVGYSGKHLETLVGIDTKGVITGVKVIYHSEPIVLIGLKEENYQKFVKQYVGRNIMESLQVGKGISMDAVTGATVTAVVQNAIILRSAKMVASEAGLIKFKEGPERKISKKFNAMTWKELLKSGAVKKIVVKEKDLYGKGRGDHMELYYGLMKAPSIGRNVLGDRYYNESIKKLKEGESAIFIFSKGKGSFKGSGFARGGIFERFNLEQQARVYSFRDTDFNILTDIKAKGAPEIREGGLFIIRGKDFVEDGSFKFNLILSYRVQGKKQFKSFSSDYKIPDRFLE